MHSSKKSGGTCILLVISLSIYISLSIQWFISYFSVFLFALDTYPRLESTNPGMHKLCL